MINQLIELGQKLKSYLQKKITIKHIWTELLTFLNYGRVDEDILKKITKLEKSNPIRIKLKKESKNWIWY